MLGVRGGRCDLVVDPSGPQPERRVNRIVVGMDEVVHRAWVSRIRGKDLLRYGSGSHVDTEVASALGGAENRQGRERPRRQILRERLGEHPQGL